jgi:hypothetical protein
VKDLDPDVYDNLTKIDPKIAGIYEGAIRVLNDNNNSERIHQSAHSMREMINRLTGNIRIESDHKNLVGDTLKRKLVRSFDPSGGPPIGFEEPYEKIKKNHDWFVNVSHHGAQPSEEEYYSRLTEHEANLKKFFEPYFTVLDKIDKLLLKVSHSERATLFIDINFDYCYHLLNGFLKSMESSVSLSWEEILELCYRLLDTSKESGSNRGGMNSIVFVSAQLLRAGLGGNANIVPIGLREKALSVINRLVAVAKDRDDLSFLINEREIRVDYYDTMINSTLYCSIECLFFYNSWVIAALSAENGRHELIPDVRQVLDRLLCEKSAKVQVLCAISAHLAFLISLDAVGQDDI